MKKILCLLLTVIMLCGVVPVTANSVESTLPFTDVKESHWWYEAVSYCYENALLKGMSDAEFGPAVTLTRAMFVQALATFEGVDAADLRDEESPFTDVKESHWFYVAVEWARQNGIVGGMTETAFAPGGALTRAQMARLFHQYAAYKGLDTTVAADVSAFDDAAKIPEWALEGMKYCVGAELFVGSDNKLTPSATATRAQLATVMMKFHALKTDMSCTHTWGMWSNTTLPTDEAAGTETRICTLCGEAEIREVTAYNGRIVCWGDSLTQGIFTGFEDLAEVPYPERVSRLLGVETVNYGIGGDMAFQVACRQGGTPMYAYATEAEPFVIPAEGTTRITIYNEIGESHLKYNFIGVAKYNLFTGINPVNIGGVWGEITGENEDYYYFTRLEAGEEVVFTEHVPIDIHSMMDKKEDDILIIWAGHNDIPQPWETDVQDEIVEQIKNMIESAGTDEYIVLSLISERYVPGYAETNAKIKEYLESIGEGEKYLDVRAYLADPKHLENLGINPTETDREWLAQGRIPASLYVEKAVSAKIHLTQAGYDLLAQHVADKIVDLGYLTN